MSAPQDSLPKSLNIHRYQRTNKAYVEDLGDGVTLTLMLIPSGEFVMGAPIHEPGSQDNERPQRLVTIPQFLMGRTPVTQAQWRMIAEYDQIDIALDPDPSRFKGGDLPVEQVNWGEATEFCKRLSTKTGKAYGLPSEAQWEYACRAFPRHQLGAAKIEETTIAENVTAFHFGAVLTSELANYAREIGQTTAVGNYPANDWGLCDLHGNVDEWCEDAWHDNYEGAPNNGLAWLGGDFRVLRGGSWNAFPKDCRSAKRFRNKPNESRSTFGFRVCCIPPIAL